MKIQVEHQSYINSIYQLSDNDELILSDDLTEDELEILHNYLIKIKENLESNLKKPLIINQLAEKYDISYNAAEIDIREAFNKRIDMVLADLAVIDEWCKENDLPIPGSQEAVDSKKQHQRLSDKAIKQQDKERAKREKQKYPPMRQTVSFDLLKKLENQNYTLTDDDKIIINHLNFDTHRTRYTKPIRDKYKIVTKILISENIITLKEFYGIIDCQDSDYYRKYYKNSFLYECTIGKFKKIGKLKDTEFIERYRDEKTNEIKSVFLIK